MTSNESLVLASGTLLHGSVYQYKVERVLGQGSFGITYLASTRITGPLGEVTVQVALKEFFAKDLDSRLSDGTVTARTEGGIANKYAQAFWREAENLSKMKHPGIVNVLEAFEAKGTYYYSMEYLSGGSLDDKVKGSGISEKEALPLISKVGAALSYMHGRKMMHLDLKPKNIMLKSDGSPVIIDFGLSKQYEENGEPESSTTIGLGTPGYAPLEQATQTSSGAFQPTLDIYALGGTLFKMLTGETPPAATLILNKKESLAPSLRKKGVSDIVVAAICKAMSPLMDDRPQSVGKFLTLLDGEEEGTIDKPTPVPPQPVPPQPLPPQPVPEPNPGPSESGKTVWKRYGIIGGIAVILVICAAILFLLIRTSSGTSNKQGSRLERLLQAADTVVFINGKPYPMVFVSGGTFEMGESDSKHKVTLDGYYIGTIEVTQSIWNSVVSNNPSHTIGNELPVDYLSYNHCIEFITRINNSFGHNFSLPTEAQWEYAAIGGEESKGHVYSGSDDINTVAWNLNNSNKKIHPVASLLPNELGIYDMTGNVREWCSDYYADYPLKAETNPKGPKKGDYVCLRGGDISSSAVKSQVTRRSWGRKNSREFTGFRLVLNPSSSVATKMNESTVKEVGSVRFASTPSGAVIWIDGKNTQKTTPVIINGITVGKHSVYLSLDGYETYECMITVTSKKRGVLDKALEKLSNSTPQNQSFVSSDGVTKSNPSPQNASEDNSKTNNTTYQEVLEEEVEEEEEAIPFQLTEQKPSFNGGDANEFSKWVNSRLVYPEVAKEYGLQGKITLQFTVEADGSVTNVRVLQGAYSPNETFDKIINDCKKLHKKDESVKVPTIEELRDASRSLEKEAVRVVSSSPKWIPGKQRDRAVKVTYTFPVIFQLR